MTRSYIMDCQNLGKNRKNLCHSDKNGLSRMPGCNDHPMLKVMESPIGWLSTKKWMMGRNCISCMLSNYQYIRQQIYIIILKLVCFKYFIAMCKHMLLWYFVFTSLICKNLIIVRSFYLKIIVAQLSISSCRKISNQFTHFTTFLQKRNIICTTAVMTLLFFERRGITMVLLFYCRYSD